jgi:hypothetical protein
VLLIFTGGVDHRSVDKMSMFTLCSCRQYIEHRMNWHLAIEKNHAALKRMLAMLIAMVAVSGNDRPATLPRHLQRFVLRLLRLAEAATRRLIIIATRGLAVKLPKPRETRPQPSKPSLDWHNALGIAVRPGALPVSAKARRPKPSPIPSLSLLDPMKRFGARRRRYAQPAALPRIGLIGDPYSPFLQPPPAPVVPTPDDPLDARRIHLRLDALNRALDDLPGQAMRMARWQARRDARLAAARAGDPELSPSPPFRPPGQRRVRPCAACREKYPTQTPLPPLLPHAAGPSPGWRRKSNHDVYEVLNELHGLAVWASERRDSS